MQRAKNEKLKKQFVDKMLLFLNNKYSRVFKDKGFTNEKLRLEVNKLLGNQNYKTFDYQTNLKKVEKSILTKVSKMGDVKYEPVQMSKINELLKFDKEQYLMEEKTKKKVNKSKTKSKSKEKNIRTKSGPKPKKNIKENQKVPNLEKENINSTIIDKMTIIIEIKRKIKFLNLSSINKIFN